MQDNIGQQTKTNLFIVENFESLPLELEYKGEFGPELVLFMPFCHWLGQFGLLKNRRIKTYSGMSVFYDDLDCLGVIEKPEQRDYVPSQARSLWLPRKNEHDFDKKGPTVLHLYPDLRIKFLKYPLLPSIGTDSKPILVIHNKHNDEWGAGAINYISLETLDYLFKFLKRQYTIVYIRHGMLNNSEGFVDDHNDTLPFNDFSLLKLHPEVLVFDHLFEEHRKKGGTQDVNGFKCAILSRCHHFISSQGGGSHQIAMFSGSLLVVLHKRGSEEHWAYNNGYYSFMARVPPILAVCRTDNDLVNVASVFNNTKMIEDRVIVDSGNAQLLMQYSPWTIAKR